MSLRNTPQAWGLLSILFHWILALVIVSLFLLGLWMVSLDYYSPWYQTAPDWHISVGVLLMVFMFLHLCWRLLSPRPRELETYKLWERMLSRVTHVSIYMLVFAMLPTGYLIVTAEGRDLEVFNWLTLPALVDNASAYVDLAGDIHEYVAYSIIALALLHAAGAIKHHFFDKDVTLTRMLGIRADSKN